MCFFPNKNNYEHVSASAYVSVVVAVLDFALDFALDFESDCGDCDENFSHFGWWIVSGSSFQSIYALDAMSRANTAAFSDVPI